MKNSGVMEYVHVYILTASQASKKCGNYINNIESACNARNGGSICGSGRSPGEGNFNPVQDSCMENSMSGGPWWATVCGVAKNWMQLSGKHFHIYDIMSYRQRNVCMFHNDCTRMYHTVCLSYIKR